jgi:hypothetical protein
MTDRARSDLSLATLLVALVAVAVAGIVGVAFAGEAPTVPIPPSPPPTAVGDTPAAFIGKWRGYETHDKEAVAIYLDIKGGAAGKKVGEIVLPADKCRVDLMLGDAQPTVLTVRAEPAKGCGPVNATLTAERDGSLKYSGARQEGPGVVAGLQRYTGDIPGE